MARKPTDKIEEQPQDAKGQPGSSVEEQPDTSATTGQSDATVTEQSDANATGQSGATAMALSETGAESAETERVVAESDLGSDPDRTEWFEAVSAPEPKQTADFADDVTDIMEPIRSSHPVNAVVDHPTESVQRTMRRNQGHFRHGVAAAIVSILVLFGIGVGAGAYYRHVQEERQAAEIAAENERKAAEAMEERDRAAEEAEAQKALEASRTPRQVKFLISSLEYDGTATRIPMVVTGTDFEGNDVDTEVFVNAEGDGVWLVPGEYTATIPAAPIRSDGTLYSVQPDTYPLNVPDDDQEQITVDQAIVLIPMAAKDVTEEIVVNACEWARKDTDNAEVSEANASLAGKAIEERKAKEKEAQEKAALNETRASIAQQFASSFFTNIKFPNAKDDSEVLLMSNWSEVVAQYVAPGSSAQQKLGRGPDPEDAYTFTVSADAVSVSGDNVVVDCKVISTNTPKSGWTRDPYDARMTVTFNENNKVTNFTIA